jgi:hypothetical protein
MAPPEPLLTRCPHCQHALNLPEAYLGQVVSCLECHAPFRAPVRAGDGLTAPEPLPKPTRIPARLFVPTFGLLLLGFAGLFINGYLAVWMNGDPEAAGKFAEANLFFMLETDPPPAKTKDGQAEKLPPEEEKKRREENADKQQRLAKDAAARVSAPGMIRIRIAFAAVSLGVVAGGFCIALRRGYWYCFVACALVSVNSPDIGCCFVGIVVGIWGFMALISDEGRRHFGRG